MRDTVFPIARLREQARRSRHAALAMEPSDARSAIERIAERWELMARVEARQAELTSAANDR
jgi:hypothetical protein